MSLYKRQYSQYWWIQIWTPERKRLRFSSGTPDREKAAIVEQSLLLAYGRTTPKQRIIAMLDSIYGTEENAIELAKIWETYTNWVTTSGTQLVPKTLNERKFNVHRFRKWAAENWPSAHTAGDVTRAVASAYATYLANTGIKATTRSNIISELSTVWNTLQRITEDIQNPWKLFVPKRNDSTRGKAYSIAQEKAVLEAAGKIGHHWKLACLIARHTGLRYSSIARLKWSEVDLEKQIIHHVPPKTQRYDISVVLPIAKPLLEELKAESQTRSESEYLLPEHAAYYPNTRKAGGPRPYSDVLELAKLAGSGYTFHSWRHTFRTRLSEAHVSTEIAKKLGGWTKDNTAARYDHADRLAELRTAVDAAAGHRKKVKPVARSTASTGTA